MTVPDSSWRSYLSCTEWGASPKQWLTWSWIIPDTICDTDSSHFISLTSAEPKFYRQFDSVRYELICSPRIIHWYVRANSNNRPRWSSQCEILQMWLCPFNSALSLVFPFNLQFYTVIYLRFLLLAFIPNCHYFLLITSLLFLLFLDQIRRYIGLRNFSWYLHCFAYWHFAFEYLLNLIRMPGFITLAFFSIWPLRNTNLLVLL